jgi:hypothetical protein
VTDVKKKCLLRHVLLVLCAGPVLWTAGCGGGLGDIPPAGTAESGQVTLLWNEVREADGYAVYMSTSPGVTWLNGYRIPSSDNTVTISALSPGTTYYFIVTAIGATGTIGTSKEMSYRAVQNQTGLMDFDDIVGQAASKEPTVAQPPGAKGITIAWEPVPGATAYNLYWRDRPGVTKLNGRKIENVTNPYTVTGWQTGQTYYFVITAINPGGESQESAEMSYRVP